MFFIHFTSEISPPINGAIITTTKISLVLLSIGIEIQDADEKALCAPKARTVP